MTLLLSMLNRDQAILVSDRRLSNNGQVVEDDSNKAGVIGTRDARLAFAFTGPARLDWLGNRFETLPWLTDALKKSARADHLMEPMIQRLAEQAGRDIKKLPVTRAQKRLTIVLLGYSYDYDPPRGYYWRISNYEGGPEDEPLTEVRDSFTAVYWRSICPPGECVCLGGVAGCHTAVSNVDVASLHSLVHERKPVRALVGKALEVFSTAAKTAQARNTIGGRVTSIVLPSDPDQDYYLDYHSDRPTHETGGIVHIDARGGEHGEWAVNTLSVQAYDASGRPVIQSVPRVGRNDPCPCGNGEKYKHCHGRF